MLTYRVMPPHGRLELQPAKRIKMVARSLHFGAAAEVARRPPWRTAAQPAEGGGYGLGAAFHFCKRSGSVPMKCMCMFDAVPGQAKCAHCVRGALSGHSHKGGAGKQERSGR